MTYRLIKASAHATGLADRSVHCDCQQCGAPLTGGLDTYGPLGGELCQTDYWGLVDLDKEQRHRQHGHNRDHRARRPDRLYYGS